MPDTYPELQADKPMKSRSPAINQWIADIGTELATLEKQIAVIHERVEPFLRQYEAEANPEREVPRSPRDGKSHVSEQLSDIQVRIATLNLHCISIHEQIDWQI